MGWRGRSRVQRTGGCQPPVFTRREAACEQRCHLMRERAVAERKLGAKAQHTPSKLLVRNTDDLRVVVGVNDHETAAGLDDARHLGQRSHWIGEMLKCAVCPRAVEAVRLE